jgi:hypothetical protein
MAPFGFEQGRVLRQLQYSGVLQMVRIRRSGFPSRMSFAEFEARFGILLLGQHEAMAEHSVRAEPSARGRDAADITAASRTASGLVKRGGGVAPPAPSPKPASIRRNPIQVLVKKAGLGAAAKSETNQAQVELEAAQTAGRGDCLLILRRACLFEHRHYAFGKSMVFLRNGVEATLSTTVASQMKCVLWLQKMARGRAVRAASRARQAAADAQRRQVEEETARRAAAAPVLQAAARGAAARAAAAAARQANADRSGALLRAAHGFLIARWLASRREAWLAPRRAARLECQRLARGFLGRRRAARALLRANTPPAMLKLQSALCRAVLVARARRLLREGHARRTLQTYSRRRAGARGAHRRRESIALLQRASRGARGRATARERRRAVLRLQRAVLRMRAQTFGPAELAEACDSLFTAVYEDDEDATSRLLAHHPNLLLVRQNVGGQRAGLAHAAAAGGATRVAPSLYLQMYRAARAARPGAAWGSDKEELAGADPVSELRDALAHCVTLRDADGRTPLHYAARAGQLTFVQWGVGLLALRPAGELGAADLFDVGPDAGEEALAAEKAELRCGLLPVSMPGGGALLRKMVVLGQTSLKVYAAPARDPAVGGAQTGAHSAPQPPVGAVPLLTLQCDKLLYRRSDARGKRDVIEVVILSRPGRRYPLGGHDAQPANGDVLELHMPSAAEARAWMAALHSPRYLLSRGMHLASAVAGREAAPGQLDLWERWALVNHRDGRGETMLHAAVRGTEPGENDGRTRLMAWLVDCGALLLPQPGSVTEVGAPPGPRQPDDGEILQSLYGRFSAPRMPRGSRSSWADRLSSADGDGTDNAGSGADVSSAFELIARLTCRAAHDPAYDRLSAGSVAVLAGHGAAELNRSPVAAHVAEVLSRFSGRLAAAGARRTLAALRAAAGTVPLPAEPPADRRMRPPPPPTADSQNRSLVMLSLTRLDCAVAEPSNLRLAVCMMHEPTYGPVGARRPAAAAGGALAARAAMFERGSVAETPTATNPAPADDTSATGVHAEAAVADAALACAGAMPGDAGEQGASPAGASSKLAALVPEQMTAGPIASGASGVLWWYRTWSAAYLPGEEGAVLLIKLLRTAGSPKTTTQPASPTRASLSASPAAGAPPAAVADEVVGWVALPLEEIGEHHLQMRAPPLPTSLADARAPSSAPTSAWLHCELALGVTGSLAAFATRHSDLARVAGVATAGVATRVSGTGDSPMLEKKESVLFIPSFGCRSSTVSALSCARTNPASSASPPSARVTGASPGASDRRAPEPNVESVGAPGTLGDATSKSGRSPPRWVRSPARPLSGRLSTRSSGRLSASEGVTPPRARSHATALHAQPAGGSSAGAGSSTPPTPAIRPATLSLLGEPLHAPPPPPPTPPPPLPSKAPHPAPRRTPQPPPRLDHSGSSFLSPPRLTPRSSRLSEKETRAAIAMLDELPEAPLDLVPIVLTGSSDTATAGTDKRERVIELVRAAAAATRSGEHELAARGYLHAFALCGSTSLLISVGNMFIRLGIADAAVRIFAHLSHMPSLLSADQHSQVLLRLEQLRSGVPPPALRPGLSALPTVVAVLEESM